MKEYIKEMNYSSDRIEAERIAEGTYKGLDYYVLNFGTHPCAYIDVTDTWLNGKEYCDIDIHCHYGLTYSRNHLTTVDKNGWFIGWDYAHYGDFDGYEMMYPSDLQSGGKHWTTEEIVIECKNVIDQIKVLPKPTNFDRLQNMNVDEFVEELYSNIPDDMNLQFIFGSWRNKEQIKEWLQSEI